MTILSVGAIEINSGPTKSPSASKLATTKAGLVNPIANVSSNMVQSSVSNDILNSNTSNTGSVGNYSTAAFSDNTIVTGTLNAATGATTAMAIDTTGKQLEQTGIGNVGVTIAGADTAKLTTNTTGNPLPVTMQASQVAAPAVTSLPTMSGLNLAETSTINSVKNNSKTITSTNTASAVDGSSKASAKNILLGAGVGGAMIKGNTSIVNNGSAEFAVDVTGSLDSDLTSMVSMPTSLAALTQSTTPTSTPTPTPIPVTTTLTYGPTGILTSSITTPTVSSFTGPMIRTNELKNTAKTSTKAIMSNDTTSVLDASSISDAANTIESNGLGITGITDSSNVTTFGATKATVKVTGAKGATMNSTIQNAGSTTPAVV